jgi:S-DNA-T family DNA segregation ATPase FtsK/SpoIIIE
MDQKERRDEIISLTFFALALYLALAILSGFLPATGIVGRFHDGMGPFGAWLRGRLIAGFGWPATLLLPLLPLVHGLRIFGKTIRSETDRSWLLFLLGLFFLVPIGFGIYERVPLGTLSPLSGVYGAFISYYVAGAIGAGGAWILVGLLFLALSVGAIALNPVRLLVPQGAAEGDVAVAEKEKPKRKKKTKDVALEPAPEEMPGIDSWLATDQAPPEEPVKDKKSKKKSKAELTAEHDEKIAAAIDAHVAEPDDELPPPSLMEAVKVRDRADESRALEALGAKLIETLKNFKVEATLGPHTTGPVVTQFEVTPSQGVKVRQIANLSNDLALAMKAQSIRIVAPIPGRGAVGVEVPNPTAETVSIREMIESDEFNKQGVRALPIILGKDLEGKPVVADLAKMPHLLIAGATGSGKSVCVNAIITSLVYRHTPRTLRFLMVDPKMVELSVYNKLPHLRHKVITDNRDAASVLKWAQIEMQQRYELCAENGCRNIQEFNKRVRSGTGMRWPKRPNVAFEVREYTDGILPYIVVVIDELADLMMTVQSEVETPLAILAQKARAIGIHLILATQRPSVNVITGLIKANFPSRIAFRVASQVDSRTIIDGMGAESLLGNGDMLFIPPGKSDLSRIQGALITSEDTERLLGWYEERAAARKAAAEAKGLLPEEPRVEADILEEMRLREAEAAGDGAEIGDPSERDKLFREAAEACIQNQGGSTSLLQRRLKVGYGRAARLIDQLQEAGILGPPDGSKPRDILIGFDELERIAGPKA